jgi:hypothetical protein
MVLVSDTSGKVSASSISTTVLGYLSGVTSAIQTQLNGKQNSLPTGGSSSNWLRGDLTWQTISVLPTGGSVGNFLTGGGTSTPSWTAIRQVPTGGTAGQFLRQDSTWATVDTLPTGGTTSTYLQSGTTRTWADFATSVRASTIGTITNSNTILASTDTLTTAFGKIQGQINAKQNSLPTGGSSSNFLRGDLTWQAMSIPTAIIVNSISATGTSPVIGASAARFSNGYFTALNVSTSGIIEQTGSGNFVTLRNTTGDGVRLRAVGRVELEGSATITAYIGSVQILWCDSTGIKIGGNSYTAQRIGFYGATPIARTTGWTNMATTDTLANTITRVNAITTFLRTIGLTT